MDNLLSKTRITPFTALLVSTAFAVILVVVDVTTGPYLNLAIFKSVALLVCAGARNRRFLWGMCLALLITNFSVLAIEWSASMPELRASTLANRIFTAITLVLI